MPRIFAVITALLFCSRSLTCAAEIREVPQLAECFKAEGVSGTFVLLDPQRDTAFVHNPSRAEERFVPASTFKIVNSLIGLKTAAVPNVDEVLPYGGAPQRIKAWEKDMSLRQAIRVSNVPVYQELARRIGLERMKENVTAFHYGNQSIGTVVDQFWLDGPLKVSALEQADFLARLAQRKLPVAEEHVAAVEEITLLETQNGARLHAKTGWMPPIGWWVGWVRKDTEVFSFAVNIDLPEEADAGKRITVGKACLRALGKWK